MASTWAGSWGDPNAWASSWDISDDRLSGGDDFGSEAERRRIYQHQMEGLAKMPIISRHFALPDYKVIEEPPVNLQEITDEDDIIAILHLID